MLVPPCMRRISSRNERSGFKPPTANLAGQNHEPSTVPGVPTPGRCVPCDISLQQEPLRSLAALGLALPSACSAPTIVRRLRAAVHLRVEDHQRRPGEPTRGIPLPPDRYAPQHSQWRTHVANPSNASIASLFNFILQFSTTVFSRALKYVMQT